MVSHVASSALSAVMFASTLFAPLPQASASPTVLTQALPENNFVGHTIQTNESLSMLAKEYYGSEDFWTTLWNDNPWIGNADYLESGWLLAIRTEKPKAPEELKEELRQRSSPVDSSSNSLILQPSPVFDENRNNSSSPAPLKSGSVANTPSYEDVYKAAGAKFGVPWQILYGIHMTETGGRSGEIYNYSGSGAQGPMQFMPGTFRAYEIDGDGDGVADINNAVDAIYTAANYLAKHGDLMNGLRSYGGNISGTLVLARERGYTL